MNTGCTQNTQSDIQRLFVHFPRLSRTTYVISMLFQNCSIKWTSNKSEYCLGSYYLIAKYQVHE